MAAFGTMTQFAVCFLTRSLAVQETIRRQLETGTLLASIFQCMEEDGLSVIRKNGCVALQYVIKVLYHVTDDASDSPQNGSSEVEKIQATSHMSEVQDPPGQVMPIVTHSKMSEQLWRNIYPELLKRLDDSENEVRIVACRTFSIFISAMPDALDTSTIQHMATNLLLHMDDADGNVQDAVCETACQLASAHAEVTEGELTKVRGVHRSTIFIDRVSAVLQK